MHIYSEHLLRQPQLELVARAAGAEEDARRQDRDDTHLEPGAAADLDVVADPEGSINAAYYLFIKLLPAH